MMTLHTRSIGSDKGYKVMATHEPLTARRCRAIFVVDIVRVPTTQGTFTIKLLRCKVLPEPLDKGCKAMKLCKTKGRPKSTSTRSIGSDRRFGKEHGDNLVPTACDSVVQGRLSIYIACVDVYAGRCKQFAYNFGSAAFNSYMKRRSAEMATVLVDISMQFFDETANKE